MIKSAYISSVYVVVVIGLGELSSGDWYEPGSLFVVSE